MKADDALDRLERIHIAHFKLDHPAYAALATVRDELRIGEMRRIEGEKMLTELQQLREERDALIRDRERWRLEWQAEVKAAEAEVARLKHLMDCADTPMMRDVLERVAELENGLRRVLSEAPYLDGPEKELIRALLADSPDGAKPEGGET